MPLFFIISGILFKESSFSNIFNKGIQRIITPYIIIASICLIVGLVHKFIIDEISMGHSIYNIIGIFTGSDIFGKGYMDYSGPLWFCYALFLIYIGTTLLLKINNRGGDLAFFTLTILFLYIGNVLPFRLDSAIVGGFFFFLGYRFKSYWIKINEMKVKTKIALSILSILILILVAYFSDDFSNKQVLSINAGYYGKIPPLYIFSGICGTILIMCIASMFSKYKWSPIFILSNGMIVILGFQKLLMGFFRDYLTSYNIGIVIVFTIFILYICYLLILLIDKYFPIILGGRKVK